jgi:integrase
VDVAPAGRPTRPRRTTRGQVLIAGAHDGTILDRGGKSYKPSTARGYEQLLRAYVVPALGGWKLSELQRRDVQDFLDGLRSQGLSPSTIANILDPLRVIFRRAIRRDEVALDPTENLDLPAIRGRRDRIEPPEVAHELLAALPDSERAFWAVALFCGLRRGELRGLQWTNVDFENGVIRVERSWDPVKGPVDVKTGAGRRAVPMAFVVVPGGEEQPRERLDAYVNPPKPRPTVAHTVAQAHENDETPVNTGVLK